MKLLKELRDLEVTGKKIPKSKEDYTIRIAARAIILDEKGNIAILSTPKSKHYHHKLPGGGVEGEEDIIVTLKREIKEEVGCDIKIIQEVGEIIEYKNDYNQKQTSHCFLVRLKGKKGKPNFTKEEKEAGYEVKWLSFKDAIRLFEDNVPEDYTAKFIRLRDYTFLSESKKIIKRLLTIRCK
jgi:8-oxo-dGTP diphosphatase